MIKPFFALSTLLLLGACTTTTQPARPAIDDPALDRFTADELVKFGSENEFRRYLNNVKRAGRKYNIWWANHTAATQLAQACTDPEDCEEDIVIVTGSRQSSSASSPTSVTNTQNAGVDEGDIVKQYKNFLIVLQDGRLFSIDTGHDSSDMALVDRVDVYRDIEYDAWYDELLISGNQILVTGYSYEADATELAVFDISDAGRITHRATFYKSSDDYYDTDNYATRLVDGNLILHTPIDLTNLELDGAVEWPVVRRWTGVEHKGKPWTKGRDLFDARDIHYPIQRTVEPVLHTISVCPLDAKEGELNCETRAVIGPQGAEYYVSRDAAYLWTHPSWGDTDHRDSGECPVDEHASARDVTKSVLFSFPLDGGRVEAQHTYGVPHNQFSMESDGTTFKALVHWQPSSCENDAEVMPLAYMAAPLTRFSTNPRRAAATYYTAVPGFPGKGLENRFTETHLIYAGRKSYWDNARKSDGTPPPVTVVPHAAPEQAVQLTLNHPVIRAERAGDNFILTGHDVDSGLFVSLVDVRAEPRVADTLKIAGRYESEGRSHAFNASIRPDGSGIMGLPTTRREQASGRGWWRSIGSDLSFMQVDAQGQINSLGPVLQSEDAVHEDYDCEMSCVDWYGNTRPVFLNGRVFALMGTELVEARVMERGITGGQIVPIARVDISAPLDAGEVN